MNPKAIKFFIASLFLTLVFANNGKAQTFVMYTICENSNFGFKIGGERSLTYDNLYGGLRFGFHKEPKETGRSYDIHRHDQRTALTFGMTHRFCNYFNIYGEAGFGAFSYQYTTGYFSAQDWLDFIDDFGQDLPSGGVYANGLEFETGILFNFRAISASFGITTINFKHYEFTIGLGLNHNY